jgi:hypothetical protein
VKEKCETLASNSNLHWEILGDRAFVKSVVWFCLGEQYI